MSLFVSKMSGHAQVSYAEAGNILEQTVTRIRTVRHFSNNSSIYIYRCNLCLMIYNVA